MLTLRDLKKMIQTPEKNEKIPTDKLLKERKIPVVVSKKIGNGEGMALVTVFQNGYAMYQTAGRATVFPVSSCRYEYESVMNGKTVRMEESFFDEKEWYLSLLMIGEDRIVYWEQKTHKQIASMYGMSRSSVSDAVHKALMKISRSFDENGEPR